MGASARKLAHKPPIRMPRATGSPLRHWLSTMTPPPLNHSPLRAAFALASASATAVELPKPRVKHRAEPRKPAAAAPEKPKRAAEQQKLLLDDLRRFPHSAPALTFRPPRTKSGWPSKSRCATWCANTPARPAKDNPRGAPADRRQQPGSPKQLIFAAVPLINASAAKSRSAKSANSRGSLGWKLSPRGFRTCLA